MDRTRYFPMFVNLEKRKVLVAGAGTIACRRIRTLLEFGAQITVAAPEICCELEQYEAEGKITVLRRKAGEENWEDLFLFLACTDDSVENRRLCAAARAAGILANNCSSREDCDFYFPSVICQEDLVIGINGGGNSHRKVKEVRRNLEEYLDAQDIYGDREYLKKKNLEQ